MARHARPAPLYNAPATAPCGTLAGLAVAPRFRTASNSPRSCTPRPARLHPSFAQGAATISPPQPPSGPIRPTAALLDGRIGPPTADVAAQYPTRPTIRFLSAAHRRLSGASNLLAPGLVANGDGVRTARGNFAATLAVDSHRYHQRTAHHVTFLARFQVGRIQPQVRPLAQQRSLQETA